MHNFIAWNFLINFTQKYQNIITILGYSVKIGTKVENPKVFNVLI